MAVTKKIRFEVFKRDGFQCAYCGKAPPEVVLECDHIQAKSAGGGDEINNLLAACFDCNRGKSNIAIEKAPQQLVDNLEVLKEKEAQLAAYHKYTKKIERRISSQIESVNLAFQSTFPKKELTESFKRGTVKKFVTRLSTAEVEDAMYLACSRITNADQAIRYFCGVCWNKIRAQEGTKQSLSKQIIRLWNQLRAKYAKASNYYSERDIERLEQVYSEDDMAFLEECMRFSLDKLANGPHQGYWKNFMWFAQDDNLRKAKECQGDSQ